MGQTLCTCMCLDHKLYKTDPAAVNETFLHSLTKVLESGCYIHETFSMHD